MTEILPIEIVITIIEFVDHDTFLVCHLLSKKIYQNLRSSHNCYRLWFLRYESTVRARLKYRTRGGTRNENHLMNSFVLDRLQKEYTTKIHDREYWRRKYLENLTLRKQKVVSHLLHQSSGEMWFVMFSEDGRYVLGGGEKFFGLFEVTTENKFKNSKLLVSGLNVDCVSGTFSPDSKHFIVVTTYNHGRLKATFMIFEIPETNEETIYSESIETLFHSSASHDDSSFDDSFGIGFNNSQNNEISNFKVTMGRMNLKFKQHVSTSSPKTSEVFQEKNYVASFDPFIGIARPTLNFSITPCFLTDDRLIYCEDLIQNCLTFSICKLTCRTLKRTAKIEVLLDISDFDKNFKELTGYCPVRGMSNFTVSTFEIEQNKKNSCLMAFDSKVDPTLMDTYDTVVFFDLPKIKEEEEEEVGENDECEMNFLKLSDLDYYYLDGAISAHKYIGNRLFFLYRPWEDSDTHDALSKHYKLVIIQISIVDVEEVEKVGNKNVSRIKKRRNFEMMYEFHPFLPCFMNTTYWFSIFVSDKFIAVGSESGSFLWDATNHSFVHHQCHNWRDSYIFGSASKNLQNSLGDQESSSDEDNSDIPSKIEKDLSLASVRKFVAGNFNRFVTELKRNPVSSICFHPNSELNIFAESADDGSLRITRIREFERHRNFFSQLFQNFKQTVHDNLPNLPSMQLPQLPQLPTITMPEFNFDSITLENINLKYEQWKRQLSETKVVDCSVM